MASSKKNYKARRNALAKLKLLPRGYDYESESGKRHIRRIEQRLKASDKGVSIIAQPESFISVPVSGRGARKLKSKGYVTRRTKRGQRAIVSRQHAKGARFRESDEALILDYGNRSVISYPYEDGPATMRRIERFFAEKKKDQYLTFRVGDRNAFNITLHDMRAFDRYRDVISEAWESRGYAKPFSDSAKNPSTKEYHSSNPMEDGSLQIVEIHTTIGRRKKGKKRANKKRKAKKT